MRSAATTRATTQKNAINHTMYGYYDNHNNENHHHPFHGMHAEEEGGFGGGRLHHHHHGHGPPHGPPTHHQEAGQGPPPHHGKGKGGFLGRGTLGTTTVSVGSDSGILGGGRWGAVRWWIRPGLGGRLCDEDRRARPDPRVAPCGSAPCGSAPCLSTICQQRHLHTEPTSRAAVCARLVRR